MRLIHHCAILVFCLAGVAGGLSAADQPMNRSLQQGIRLYHENRFTDAMDRLTDVLINGSPSEKSIANEYMNKINLKMSASDNEENPLTEEEVNSNRPLGVKKARNTGAAGTVTMVAPVVQPVKTPKAPALSEDVEDAVLPRKKASAKIAEPETVEEDVVPVKPAKAAKPAVKPSVSADSFASEEDEAIPMPKKKTAAAKRPVPVVEDEETETVQTPVRSASSGGSVDRRQLMAQRIDSKISAMREKALEELSSESAVTVEGNPPSAISLNSSALYASKVTFKAGADVTLEKVAALLYTMRNASFLIVPEISSSGEPGILEMRRAMSIKSFLIRKGLSPARVDININASASDIAKRARGGRGIGILVDQDKELSLKLPAVIDQDAPPELSLGAYPQKADPSKDEGFIVEFSVRETVSKVAGWKFQIFHVDDSNQMEIIQQVAGADAAYHQTFWNARQGFFGDAYPAGKYMLVLTASDVDGRETSYKKSMQVVSGGSKTAKSSVKADEGSAEQPAVSAKKKTKTKVRRPRRKTPAAARKPATPAAAQQEEATSSPQESQETQETPETQSGDESSGGTGEEGENQ